jgi:xanthine dehydrogenase small subunit
MGAFKFRLDGRHIVDTRIAYGGMAATPKRGRAAEAALIGTSLDAPEGWEPAIAALAEDYRPIDDMRASADYRLIAVRALLRKALMEAAGLATTDSRIVGHRENAMRVA